MYCRVVYPRRWNAFFWDLDMGGPNDWGQNPRGHIERLLLHKRHPFVITGVFRFVSATVFLGRKHPPHQPESLVAEDHHKLAIQ